MDLRRRRVLIAGAACALLSAATTHNLYRQALSAALLLCAHAADTAPAQAFMLTCMFDQVSVHGPNVPPPLVLAMGSVFLVAAIMRCEKFGPGLLVACIAAPPRTGCAPLRIGVVSALSYFIKDEPLPLVHLLWVCYSPVELLPCAAMQLWTYNDERARDAFSLASSSVQAAPAPEDEVSLLHVPAQTHIATVTASKPLPLRGNAPLP